MRIIWLFVLSLWSGTAWSQAHYTWTEATRVAYRRALHLRFDEARAALAEVRAEDAENVLPELIENYIDFFTVFIREEEEEFEVLEARKQARLKALSRGPKTSPYYLYTQAEVLVHWAMVRVKFGQYVIAFSEIRRAMRLLERNERLFPDFQPTKKSLGLLRALAGTIPDEYKWGAGLLGVRGDVTRGLEDMQAVIRHGRATASFIFKEETEILYAFLLLHVGRSEGEAWQILHQSSLDASESPMACFVLANMSLYTGENDKAIAYLEQCPKGAHYFEFPYLDYLMGVAKLRRLDVDARGYFLRYLEAYKGGNYVKAAYQRVGWSYFLEADTASYRLYMDKVAVRGATRLGSDKKAEDAMLSREIPNSVLLTARLLFDGGYYPRALEALEMANLAELEAADLMLEYVYRRARILHFMGRRKEAIKDYENTLKKGAESPLYYACNAALQLGIIHEYGGASERAIVYYERCLSLKPSAYRKSLHQRAKAGLNRLGK